ncbi:hypothetical protein O988_05051 [Pseudogymnoascus sp. VKM F-3808]|nr:hypothetical protein O988_05051 [Pseudogymnoascus sp. VKM F-3808]
MRTSRISQDTSRALNATTSLTPSRSTRLTRSALAQFSLGAGAAAAAAALGSGEGDIEDAIPARGVEKRKRSAPVAAARSGVKKEEDGDKAAKREDVSDSELSSAPSSSATPPARNARRQPVKRIKRSPPPAGSSGGAAGPENWERIYDLVMKMRTDGVAADAAVDTMGCHTLAQDDASPRDQRFQTLISLMMSSQTKDTTNYVVMQKLYNELPSATPGGKPGLNLENILAVAPERLNELIWAVGFHNNKTKYIKTAAEILRDLHGGDIPDTAEGLMSLPGVGPKMAHEVAGGDKGEA